MGRVPSGWGLGRDLLVRGGGSVWLLGGLRVPSRLGGDLTLFRDFSLLDLHSAMEADDAVRDGLSVLYKRLLAGKVFVTGYAYVVGGWDFRTADCGALGQYLSVRCATDFAHVAVGVLTDATGQQVPGSYDECGTKFLCWSRDRVFRVTLVDHLEHPSDLLCRLVDSVNIQFGSGRTFSEGSFPL